jgi:hypothetical protein
MLKKKPRFYSTLVYVKVPLILHCMFLNPFSHVSVVLFDLLICAMSGAEDASSLESQNRPCRAKKNLDTAQGAECCDLGVSSQVLPSQLIPAGIPGISGDLEGQSAEKWENAQTQRRPCFHQSVTGNSEAMMTFAVVLIPCKGALPGCHT